MLNVDILMSWTLTSPHPHPTPANAGTQDCRGLGVGERSELNQERRGVEPGRSDHRQLQDCLADGHGHTRWEELELPGLLSWHINAPGHVE